MIEGHGTPRFDDDVGACVPPVLHRGKNFEPQWDELDGRLYNCGAEYKAIGGDKERYSWSKWDSNGTEHKEIAGDAEWYPWRK